MRIPVIAWLTVGVLLGVAAGGCRKAEPDRWAEAQKKSSESGVAVSEESVAGAEFNRFFPEVEKPWDIVFKQEKTGFAQASLQSEGREMALLSVSDTKNNPSARDKYRNAAETLAGLPRAEIDANTTGVLAGDRYQVQIRSLDPAFGPQEREQWLAKFNLEAIGRIQ
jgi:hypothetical protein